MAETADRWPTLGAMYHAASSRYVDDGLGPVHVVDFGGEGPPLVFVHGLGGSHANWMPVAPEVKAPMKLSAIDLPGFGLTPPLGRSGSIQASRRVLDAHLRSFGEPVLVVANSFGAAVAMHQAATAPDTVRGMVLISPVVPFSGTIDPLVAGLFSLYFVPGLATLALAGRRRVQSPAEIARMTLDLCTARMSTLEPEVVDLHIDVARRRLGFEGVDAAFAQAARSLLPILAGRGAFRRRLAAITAPTMVVQGREDRLVPLESVLGIGSLRPDWRIEILEGVGHLAMLEVPVRVAQLIDEWAAVPLAA
ncbi:hypothetical protein BH23ACT5_BH23ACT5_07680 [soil metagenome]